MNVRALSAHNPGPLTGAGSNTYLLDGPEPTLIDAGSGDVRHIADVEHALGEGSAVPAPLARVLVTHAHVDHAGGAAALHARWPDARFHKLPWPERDARYAVSWTPLRDGDEIRAGGVNLRAVHTPGHAPDHLCFFEPDSGTLFSGDLVINGGTVVIPASTGGSLADYLRSLRRVLDLQPRRVLPGHGAPIENPAALIRAYIAHRAARERQILLALNAAGATTVAALVRRIYPDLGDEVRRVAAESVLAHLVKLRDEQRVTMEPRGDESQWVIAPGAMD